MSRKPYECFRCRDNGYPNTMVYLAGKDEQGQTIQFEESGERYIHKKNPLEKPSDESVQKGINAFIMVTDLIKLEEQTHLLLADIGHKLDRLLNLAEKK